MPPCPSNWRISYRFPSTVPGWRVAGEPAANPAGVPGAGTDQPSATCRVSVTVAPPTSGGVAVIVALLPGSGVSHFSQRAAAGGLVNWHWGQSIAVAVSRAAGGFHIRDFPRRNQAFYTPSALLCCSGLTLLDLQLPAVRPPRTCSLTLHRRELIPDRVQETSPWAAKCIYKGCPATRRVGDPLCDNAPHTL